MKKRKSIANNLVIGSHDYNVKKCVTNHDGNVSFDQNGIVEQWRRVNCMINYEYVDTYDAHNNREYS